ncbi:MAG: hypothetical protein J7501_13465 [Bdellovibrio sp.]|nr:hypothetical protein [Bdellovibrio sp.]
MRTSITKLITDQQFLPTLLRLIDKAEFSIDILAYSFAIGSARGILSRTTAPFEIAEKLIQKKQRLKRKIKIRLYIEGFRETSLRNRVTADYLETHGIEVIYGTTHAKGFCFDKSILLFGSTNLTNQSLMKNYEANVLLNDPKAITGFLKYFEYYWNGGHHGGIKLTAPMIADGDFKEILLELIDSAKSSLEFSIYFFHMSEIERALIKATARGIEVRGLFHHHTSFALSYVRRTRGTASRLIASGIDHLHFGPGNLFTHSKFIVKDRKEVLLGTGNWLHEDIKVHPQLYIHLKNATLAENLVTYLNTKLTTGRDVDYGSKDDARTIQP